MIGAHKLNEDDIKIIKDLLDLGKTHQSISNIFDVSREHITKIANGQRWNDKQRSFIMKDNKPVRSNDYREFTDLPMKEVEVVDEKEALDLDQKYYLIKFIESLTGKKIKKMIVEF